MIRTLIWFVYFFLYLLFISPFLLKAKSLEKYGEKEDYDAYIHGKASNWARRLIRLAGGKVSVYGEKNIPADEPVLFVSNHQGNFDIPVILGHTNRKTGFISKVEVRKIPLISRWMKHLDCVFLDRADRRQAVKSINEGAETLANGRSLVIFPEGTRGKGKPIQEFKTGSFKLAMKSGVAIIPISIEGTYRLFEANQNKVNPGEVTITFGEPIRTHQTEKVSMGELAELTRDRIISNFREPKHIPGNDEKEGA